MLIGLIMEARDRSVGIPNHVREAVGIPGLPAVVAREEEEGGRGSTATDSKACVIL